MRVPIIRNSVIPFEGYKAMAMFPVVFVRKDCEFSDTDMNHETIHLCQQAEVAGAAAALLAVAVLATGASPWWIAAALPLFYLWYALEYAVRYVGYSRPKEAYRNISFEQEAYLNEQDPDYPVKRKPFAWAGYMFRKTYRWKNPYWDE